jgi:hypothetical protein
MQCLEASRRDLGVLPVHGISTVLPEGTEDGTWEREATVQTPGYGQEEKIQQELAPKQEERADSRGQPETPTAYASRLGVAGPESELLTKNST